MTQNIVTTLISLVLTGGLVYFFYKGTDLIDVEKKKKEAQELLVKTKEDAVKIKEEILLKVENFKKSSEEDTEKRKERIKKIEELTELREKSFLKKEERFKEMSLKITTDKEELKKKQEEGKLLEEKQIVELSKKAGKTIEQQKKEILDGYRVDLENEAVERLAKEEEFLKENTQKIAQKILINIIQRITSPTSVESRSVNITVPKDFIKGKIVGKNGKNIEEFEKHLDVAVIFNDLPNTISVSCFNLVTRRIAQVAIEKLIRLSGDITKDVVVKTIKDAGVDVDKELYGIGKAALERLGMYSETTDKELIRIIGRLQYRTSYGQNIMKHSMEVAWVAVMIGGELGLDVEMCRISGFLHDLGKAIDQEPGEKDAHDRITKELMEKYGFTDDQVNAAWAHHDSEKQKTPEALIIKAADAVSAGRPGARQESRYSYSDRIQQIDETIKEFSEIQKSFIMSAGRDIRAFVDPEKITDENMREIAKKLAGKIEENVVYPGKIRVNIIRKVEKTEIAASTK
ncbi:MAG: Rnase Y domain-containing protein [Candidatus Peregrinibacteria bacterium]|nr:Rnase Y domain-containing protein [Candidatus Peregrinibacteria bacterium]